MICWIIGRISSWQAWQHLLIKRCKVQTSNELHCLDTDVCKNLHSYLPQSKTKIVNDWAVGSPDLSSVWWKPVWTITCVTTASSWRTTSITSPKSTSHCVQNFSIVIVFKIHHNRKTHPHPSVVSIVCELGWITQLVIAIRQKQADLPITRAWMSWKVRTSYEDAFASLFAE